MKKTLRSILTLLLAFLLAAPSFLSLTTLAAKDDEELFADKAPAYMSVAFNNIAERVAGTDAVAGMTCRLVAGGYAIYVDEKTGEVVCLKLKAPGEDGEYLKDEKGVYLYDGYYSTNPYAIGQSMSSSGGSSNESVKQTLYSQLVVSYTENDKEAVMNSFKDAALNDQIVVKDIRNGVRVEYTMGREETTYLVPRRIKYSKWLDLAVQVAQNCNKAREKQQFAAFYTLFAIGSEQIAEYKSIDKSVMTDDTKQFLFTTREEGREAGLKESEFGSYWGVFPSQEEYLSDRLSNKAINEYKQSYPFIENFAFMATNPAIQTSDLRKLEQLIKLYTTYSKEQMMEDHAETEFVVQDKIPPSFKMAIEYTLNEYGLQIRLNAGNIRFDNSNYKLSNIQFLPYGGAADTNNDGFIFTPDGSGSIIKLDAIRGTQFTTTTPMYGVDYAYQNITGSNKETMRFPGFGMVETSTTKEKYTEIETYLDANGEEQEREVEKTRDIVTAHGYFGLITEGATLSNLTVLNGGALHMFASVYTSFNPRPKDSYVLDGGLSAGTDAMWTVESKRKYTGNYKLQIFILDNENSTHMGMANVYRNYLEKEGVITRLEDKGNDDIPLYIQTLGALETKGSFLGVPYDTKIALTSYVRVKEILEKFKESNITNVKVILKGITTGGLIANVPTKLGFEDVLEEGHDDVNGITFKELVQYAKDNNIQLFPDFDFTLALRDDMFDGFDSSDHLSQTINGQIAVQREYDPIWQAFVIGGAGIITPNAMTGFYDSVYEDYKEYAVGGIGVQSLGNILASDFNEEDPLNREDSRKIIVKLLNKIKEQNGNVLISGGNSYALPYATDIVDMPLDDSRYTYAAAAVPFMGIVLHGYKEYAGQPINLAGNYNYTLLKTIENGANPYYTVAYDNTSELKEWSSYSALNKYYSIKYTILVKELVTTYRVLDEALSSVKYSTIVGHEYLDDECRIVKVTYDNGDVFYLNYYREPYALELENGETLNIGSESFVKISSDKGGAK